MKRKTILLAGLFLSLLFLHSVFASEKIKIKLFYSSSCKHCIDLKTKYLPKILAKYGKSIEAEELNIADESNFKLYLALEKQFQSKASVPAILIGDYFLIGNKQIENDLENIIKRYIVNPKAPTIPLKQVNLYEEFRSTPVLAVIGAGLIDGINPCAFTVLIFFISFLTLMGYRKRDLTFIGGTFIFAVFLTYLALGLGLFKGLYELKHFYIFLKLVYYSIAMFCFVLAYLNLRDFFVYRKSKNPDSLKVKLPKPVRLHINAIINNFYRTDKDKKAQAGYNLILATFVVGFLVSLLEAVCTGQVYLPTIVFILKEPSLQARAIICLLLYNLMFVVPLFLILLSSIWGVTSKDLELFFKNKIALVKLFMSALFLGLGLFLIIGT